MIAATQLAMVLNVATTSALPVNSLVINASETGTAVIQHFRVPLLNVMSPVTGNAATACKMEILVIQTTTVAPTTAKLELVRQMLVATMAVTGQIVERRTVERTVETDRTVERRTVEIRIETGQIEERSERIERISSIHSYLYIYLFECCCMPTPLLIER
jgi:hypothetical protein